VIIAVFGASFMDKRVFGVTFTANLHLNAAIISQQSSIEECCAKDLQLEYRLGAVMGVLASNLSEEARYFAQDLYTEYSIEGLRETRVQAQGETNLAVNINKSSESLVGQIQSQDNTPGDILYP
jgi:hypothetical protein